MSEAPQQPLSRPSDRPPAEPPDQPATGPKGSRNIWTRAALVAGLVALAVLSLGAARCGGDDDEGEGAGTTPMADTTTTEATATQPQRVTVEVENAQPVGGVVHADIKQGTEVMLIVRADVEDEVHVHGYDLSAEVAPGQPAHISFLADNAGEFEVELEERTVPIAELAVTP
jgi:hypothetical protein